MDETTQAILKRASNLKTGLTSVPHRALLALLVDGGGMDARGVMLVTGDRDYRRVETALQLLLKKHVIRFNSHEGHYYVVGEGYNTSKTSKTTKSSTPSRDVPDANPSDRGAAVPRLYLFLTGLTGRDGVRISLEQAALKNMLAKAYEHVRDEANRSFQAEGLVKDYISYKVDDWIKANANQPAMLLQKSFPAYLSVIPPKPRDERRNEVQVYGKRVGYNLKTRQWVVTDDKLPN